MDFVVGLASGLLISISRSNFSNFDENANRSGFEVDDQHDVDGDED